MRHPAVSHLPSFNADHSLVKQLRAGDLTAVWVPDPRHEAMRDLTRAREAGVEDLRRKRQQVSGKRDRPTVIDVVVTRDPAQMLPAVDNPTVEIKQGDRGA